MKASTAERGLDLDEVFSVTKLEKTWKHTVRDGLRNQEIRDLHDYLDIHWNKKEFSQRIRTDILSGFYRASSPEFVLSEKKNGITRRLIIPDPRDALVLQRLVDSMEANVISSAPSERAYYSRSHKPRSMEDVDDSFSYPWWQLWPEFQDRIFEFTKNYEFLVVADIANYFDCIPLHSLRNCVSSISRFKETVLDFLFYMVESFSWRPFYIPFSGVGLPQINFDAPRLLAHCYLFKLDKEIKDNSGKNFVRWMDDIDAGVNTREEGKALLRNMELLLNSLGLRLNPAKTAILTAFEAVQHFWINENKALTVYTNLIKNNGQSDRVKKSIKKRFKAFLSQINKSKKGNWDKVLKRYLRLFGLIGDDLLVRYSEDWLFNTPSIRSHVLDYFSILNYSKTRYSILKRFILSPDCCDDIGLAQASYCLLDWDPPLSDSFRKDSVDLATQIFSKSNKGNTVAVAVSLSLIAKYGSEQELGRAISKTKHIWSKSPWCARQVVSVIPLLSKENVYLILRAVIRNGLHQALTVWENLNLIAENKDIPERMKMYLFHDPGTFPYPFQKLLIGKQVLNGTASKEKKKMVRSHIQKICKDKHLRKLLTRKTN